MFPCSLGNFPHCFFCFPQSFHHVPLSLIGFVPLSLVPVPVFVKPPGIGPILTCIVHVVMFMLIIIIAVLFELNIFSETLVSN